jgi:hypothetical protein
LLLLPLCRSRAQEWMAVLAIVGLAIALEFRQHQVFRIPIEWLDVRDDAIGVALALLVIRTVTRRRLATNSSAPQ